MSNECGDSVLMRQFQILSLTIDNVRQLFIWASKQLKVQQVKKRLVLTTRNQDTTSQETSKRSVEVDFKRTCNIELRTFC